MIKVDIKSLLTKLNNCCNKSLEAAAGLCVARTHYEVTVEHLMLKLLEIRDTDLTFILNHFSIDEGELTQSLNHAIETFQTGNSSRPVFSLFLMEWIQDACLIGSIELNAQNIQSGFLVLALLQENKQYLPPECLTILAPINGETLKSQYSTIVKGSVESSQLQKSDTSGQKMGGAPEALKKYCENFTEKAAKGDIDPVFGRDREIRQMVDILARRRKNNPIVVGEAGVGKTAVIEGLALQIANRDVPELLQDTDIYALDMGLLQAGSGVKGEFESRLKKIIEEIKASIKPVILFIDEAHTIIGAGGPSGGSDAANLLKPALARGELRTIAATTWSEYKKYFEKDTALARRFQIVKLDEPDTETTKIILRGLKDKYESAHDVIIRDDAVSAAAELSDRYISGRQLPDKAVDLLDTSAARIKVQLSAKPDILENLEKSRLAIEREKKALVRDSLHGIDIDGIRMEEIEVELIRLTERIDHYHEKWTQEKELAHQLIGVRKELSSLVLSDAEQVEERERLLKTLKQMDEQLVAAQAGTPLVRIEVDPDTVSRVVSDWTGIPLGKVMREQTQNLIRLDQNLKEKIKGQDPAIAALATSIQNSKAGLKPANQPMGIFLLVGPSGVGKTETGICIADLLFGGEKFMVTINMSEFQEKHTVSRLIGSPPGYVGYGEGGVLTEAVRQRPYSVVLLDEVEKCHPEVMNLFYQVFDKGTLSDGEGRDIDFKNTIILLTSNLASDIITEMCSDEEMPSSEILSNAIRPVLNNHFKPALLARMTVVPYFNLKTDVMADIVKLKLGKLARSIQNIHKIALEYSDDIVNEIADRCVQVETGARNIDYIMEKNLLPEMSAMILKKMTDEEMPETIFIDLNEDKSFKIEFGVS